MLHDVTELLLCLSLKCLIFKEKIFAEVKFYFQIYKARDTRNTKKVNSLTKINPQDKTLTSVYIGQVLFSSLKDIMLSPETFRGT